MGFVKNNRILKHFTKQLALTGSLLILSTLNYGIDNQGFGTTQAMTYYARTFGVQRPNGTYAIETYFLSLLNSLNFIGFAIGAYLGSVVSARYGRRMCIFSMSIWGVLMGVLCATAKTRAHMLTARILAYIYIGMELSVIPVFQSEIMPAPIRGFMVASYQLAIVAGGIIINSVCKGTSTIESNLSWQIPFALYTVIPTIVASLVWFVPESPRWLAMKGRDAEALDALQKYYGAQENFVAEDQLQTIKTALAEEAAIGTGSYRDLLTGINRKRTAIACGTAFFLQSTGQAFASSYGAIFVRQLGTIPFTTFAIVNSSLGTTAVALSMLLSDKVGRRRMMLIGTALQSMFLMVMGGTGLASPITDTMKRLIVAMLVLFAWSFNFGYAPQSYVVTTELPALNLRDKTQRVASLVNIGTNFVVAFTLPYLLNAPYAALQSKVGFIYGAMALLAFVFVFFCVPEMRGKTLEQIDALFQNGVPVRKFGSTHIDVEAPVAGSTTSDEIVDDAKIDLKESGHLDSASATGAPTHGTIRV